MDDLATYVTQYAVRGACQCGLCADAPAHPEQHQPLPEHSVDVTFFRVAAAEGARADDLRASVKSEHPEYLNGAEHSYITIGADLGDQGIALMLIGLGHVLGLWRALSPATVLPSLPHELKMQMAGAGMVSLKATGDA